MALLGVHIIIQARMNSTRLPGKVLKPFVGEYTFLQWIVERLRTSEVAEHVIVATSTASEDDMIASLCVQSEYDYYRGSEEDVLSRYWSASQRFNSKIIVRATSDNPFIDVLEMDRLVRVLVEEGLAYANNHVGGLPVGAGTECFTQAALERASIEAHDAFDREHVTPYFRRNSASFPQKNIDALLKHPLAPSVRLTLDTPEDYDFFISLGRSLRVDGLQNQPSTTDVLNHLAKHPELVAINNHVLQKTFPKL
ncbi:MAG TPA: glycosyltransferase family protein [Candidatus Paceibacterota bacterium]|nr:glycosyltransferase family protein [Candidatus Paceibacterota bacterium]